MRIITAFFIIFSILYSTEIKSADYALISDIGSSAQSIALGNIEGFSDSSTAVFDNPAGLYRTTGYSISLFTTQLMSDVHYYNVSLCGETPFGKVGVGVYEAHVNNLYTTALRMMQMKVFTKIPLLIIKTRFLNYRIKQVYLLVLM